MADTKLIVTILPGSEAAGDPVLVGNKAANLMRLAGLGLAVPPAFVLPTNWWCPDIAAGDAPLRKALADGVAVLEAAAGLTFGGTRRPLLVSVRSGAPVSMPGMLDTVLNVGLNPASLDGMIRLTGNPRLAWDCYRRLIQLYAEVVAGLPPAPFAAIVDKAVERSDAGDARALDFRALRSVTETMLACYHDLARAPFPTDPMEQLSAACAAVFRSWTSPRAASYRRLKSIPDSLGTAVTVQTMVFGNEGARSGSGVGFTRDPGSGENRLYVDMCLNGQGEDVVSGRESVLGADAMRRAMPAVYDELESIRARLEAAFADAQDFEFTVQDGRLYLLQTRAAKRTDRAALRMAVDMVQEGLIDPAEGLRRLASVDLDALVHTRFAPPLPAPLATATPAAPGVVTGVVALSAETVARQTAAGLLPILLRPETSTADIEALAACAGLLTREGSRTAHAAVVARQLGKVCLTGCRALEIGADRKQCRVGIATLSEGDAISLDGNEGFVYGGALPVVSERPSQELAIVEAWRSQAKAAAA